MRHRSGLADRQVRSITQDINIIASLHGQGGAVGRDPTVLPHVVVLDHFHAAVGRDAEQKVVIDLRSFHALKYFVLRVYLFDIEKGLVLNTHLVKFGCRPFCYVVDIMDTRKRIGVH